MVGCGSTKKKGGLVWSLAGATLAVLLTASVASPFGSIAPLSAQVTTQDTAYKRTTQTTARRPFDHRFHQALSCTSCHGSGATHRETLVRGPADCAGCHHDPRRSLACAECHAADVVAAPRTVKLSVKLQVVDTPRVRNVTFLHAAHLDPGQGLGCADCHGTAVTLARNRACESCHASHHDGVALCTNCHSPPRAGAHDNLVHRSCAGAECHAAREAPSPALSRTLCIYCHPERQDHEPGGSCAACHLIPGSGAPPPGQRGRRQ